MGGITLTVDVGETVAVLTQIQRAGANLRPFFLEVGEELAESTRYRFVTQTDPDGNPWAPLDEKYRESKRKRESKGAGKIGTLYGPLGETITFQATATEARIGTNRVEGGPFQRGNPRARNPQPRPFLGISSADRATLLDLVADYFEQAAQLP